VAPAALGSLAIARRIRTLAILICVPLLAAAAAVPFLLPPSTIDAPPPGWPAPDGVVVRGAYHVHSNQSDGTGSIDQIAAAAAAAGLEFVILTDHGDGTRPVHPPAYRHGVLCVEAVEINTSGGHYVALDLPPSPYPLAGSPASVIEDVRRLGGFGIAAHADSPRASLRWQPSGAPIDGIEWLNADSEWRDESTGALARLLLTYPFRPVETLASMLDRPAAALAIWDRSGLSRRIVGLAGADAHARLGFRQIADPYEERLHLTIPSYEATFGMFSTRVVLDAPLSGQADRDAAALLHEVRSGRAFTVIDGLAAPGGFEWTVTSGSSRAYSGEYLDLAGRVSVHVRASAPEATTFDVMRDGASVYQTHSLEFHVDVAAEPGVYRIEARLRGTTMPWLVSNPVYVGLRGRHAAAAMRPPAATTRTPVATDQWQPEASRGSASTLARGEWPDGTPAARWDFALAPGPAAGQYAALLFPAAERLDAHDRVQLRVRADRPARVWLQVRSSRDGGSRWGSTFFADQTPRSVEIFFSDLAPMGVTTGPPPLERIDAMLIVADTVNTKPGSAARVEIADLWVAK
jgi:hypothetical protein